MQPRSRRIRGQEIWVLGNPLVSNVKTLRFIQSYCKFWHDFCVKKRGLLTVQNGFRFLYRLVVLYKLYLVWLLTKTQAKLCIFYVGRDLCKVANLSSEVAVFWSKARFCFKKLANSMKVLLYIKLWKKVGHLYAKRLAESR